MLNYHLHWSARAALRAAAKQQRATLADRTLTRLYEPPLNGYDPQFLAPDS